MSPNPKTGLGNAKMEFMEILNELTTFANLPFTVMLGFVLFYWLLVIVGVMGAEALDFDFDFDADVDAHIDMDFDAGSAGVFSEALAFMHFGQVPVMIIGSMLIFFMWIFSIIANHYLIEGENLLFSFLLLLPNLFFSLILTKLVIWPFLLVPEGIDAEVESREKMIGVIGLVKTSEVTETFGQVEIEIDGPSIVINVRTRNGERLVKGDCAKIEAYNSVNDTFTVSLSKWESK